MRTRLFTPSAVFGLSALILSVLLTAAANGQADNDRQAKEEVDVAQLKTKIEQLETQITAMKKEIDELRSLLQARAIAVPSTPSDPIKYVGRLEPELVPHVSFMSLFCKPATAEDRKKIPAALSKEDRVFIGTLRLLEDREFKPMVALVKPLRGTPYVFVDIDRNGVLSTEESIRFRPLVENRYYGGEIILKFPLSAGVYKYFPVILRYWRWDRMNAEGSLELAQSIHALARGTARVAGRETRVVYAFDLKAKRVYPRRGWVGIDANGDGQVELAETSPESAIANNEDVIFRVGDHYISTESVDTATREIVLSTHAASEYRRVELTAGTEVPNFSFTDLDGNVHSLSEFRGKHVLLDFWASWCGPRCVDRVLHLKDVYKKYRSRGFEIIGINRDPMKETAGIKDFIAAHGIGWTQTLTQHINEVIEKRFRLWSSGRRILIDPDGKIILAGNEGEPQLENGQLSATLDRVLR